MKGELKVAYLHRLEESRGRWKVRARRIKVVEQCIPLTVLMAERQPACSRWVLVADVSTDREVAVDAGRHGAYTGAAQTDFDFTNSQSHIRALKGKLFRLKFNLGGLRNEVEITGYRRTHVGYVLVSLRITSPFLPRLFFCFEIVPCAITDSQSALNKIQRHEPALAHRPSK